MAAHQWRRFDASDLKPGAIGSIGDDCRPGAFYTGMITYPEQGADSIRERSTGSIPVHTRP